MKELSTGARPSTVFKALRTQDSAVWEAKLCAGLAEAFPAISSEAFDAMRIWLKKPDGEDWYVDSTIRGHLEDAGYLEEPRSPHRAISHLLDHHVPSDDTEHHDAIWLLRRIVQRVHEDFGHPLKEAVELVNLYFDRFCDPAYVAQINHSVLNIEWVFREEAASMAAHVQYYVALGHPFDHMAFIDWSRARWEKQMAARNSADG